MDLDNIYKQISYSDAYPLLILFTCALIGSFTPMTNFASIFTEALLKYRCAVPNLINDTYAVQSEEHAIIINETIPWELVDEKWILSHLHVFKYKQNSTHPYPNASIVDCDKWVFDESVFNGTVISQYVLVKKESNIITTVMTSMYMFGMLVGSFVFGRISDKYGRKKCLLIAVGIEMVAGTSAAWTGEVIGYTILRFVDGACNIGVVMGTFVYVMEFTRQNRKASLYGILSVMGALGEIVFVGYAYALRHYGWRYLQTLISMQFIVGLIMIIYIPESPKWLISKGKFIEASILLNKMAKGHDSYLMPSTNSAHGIQTENNKNVSFKVVLKSKTLFLRMICMFFQWFTVCISYYGLSLSSGNFAGNIFINALFMLAVETPACIVFFLTIDRLGRKVLYVSNSILTALSLLAAAFLQFFTSNEYSLVIQILAVLGKFGNTISFNIAFLYAAELFPTQIRNTTVGLGSVCARVGSILAPVFITLGEVIGGNFRQGLPILIFGCLTAVAAISSLTLPETKGLRLPDTIEEAENIGKPNYNILLEEDATDREVPNS